MATKITDDGNAYADTDDTDKRARREDVITRLADLMAGAFTRSEIIFGVNAYVDTDTVGKAAMREDSVKLEKDGCKITVYRSDDSATLAHFIGVGIAPSK